MRQSRIPRTGNGADNQGRDPRSPQPIHRTTGSPRVYPQSHTLDRSGEFIRTGPPEYARQDTRYTFEVVHTGGQDGFALPLLKFVQGHIA